MFPHSEICGSKLICSSPQLIAACHVLLRLLMPRHSPYALIRLNFLLNSYSAVLLNCLSFIEQFVLVFFFAVKRFDPFYVFLSVRMRSFNLNLGNCSSLPKFFGKTYSNLLFIKMCPLLSVRFYSFYFFIRFSMNIFFT